MARFGSRPDQIIDETAILLMIRHGLAEQGYDTAALGMEQLGESPILVINYNGRNYSIGVIPVPEELGG